MTLKPEKKEMISEKILTVAFNNYLKGKMEWCVCDATYCYDEDDLGPSIACHLYVLEYLIKKGII